MAQAIRMSSMTRAYGMLAVVLLRSVQAAAANVVTCVPWSLEQAAAGLAAACPLHCDEEED